MLTDLFKLQMDLLGARGELAAGMAGNWLLDKATPNGGGNRPVITFPGFLASDNTLLRLNRYLNRHGFDAQSWGLGRNLGPQEASWGEQLDALTRELGAKIRALADKHSAPVALVGQSLGGVYARELAMQMPDVVDRVIMLGSPSFHPYLTTHVNRVVSLFGYWLSRKSHAELAGRAGLLHWDADQPPLPCVSVHSPVDGVVDEASSVIPQYIVEQSNHSAPRAAREPPRSVLAHRHVHQSLRTTRHRGPSRAGSRRLGGVRSVSVLSRQPAVGRFEALSRRGYRLRIGEHCSTCGVLMMTVPAVKLPDAIVTLSDEHRYMSLLLDTLDEQLHATDLTAREDFFLMQDIVHYLHEYSDGVHHPTEDLMFDKLVGRNPARELDIARLRREHDLLSANTDELLELMEVATKRRTPETAEAVRVATDEYIDRLRSHIDFEESELFPSAVRCLANEDWHSIETRLDASKDPLFGPTVQRDFRVLYEYFSDRADQISRQMTRIGFLQLDNMIVSADAVENGVTEMWDMLQDHVDSLGREFRTVADNSFDGRGLLPTLALQAGYAGFVGKTALEAGGKAASIYFRTLKNATVLLFRGS
jgi:hemerythrin-like domain-containing protein/pimeloyl-ACP methyl ester carboxylesterase